MNQSLKKLIHQKLQIFSCRHSYNEFIQEHAEDTKKLISPLPPVTSSFPAHQVVFYTGILMTPLSRHSLLQKTAVLLEAFCFAFLHLFCISPADQMLMLADCQVHYSIWISKSKYK